MEHEAATAAGDDLRLDVDRAGRTGEPEVVLAEHKTPEQCARAVAGLVAAGASPVLATRANVMHVAAVLDLVPDAVYVRDAQLIVARRATEERTGHVAIVAAGTSDLPVARECEATLDAFRVSSEVITDVGIAGLHRLLAVQDDLARADVIVAIAGMEGALPTAIAALVDVPVIAVPTSVGYGAAFEGLAALLGMLTSCAPGISVVNIDNGFGAAVVAQRILRVGGPPVIVGHLDAAAGASGDMFLGAIVSAGVAIERLQAAVGALPLGGVEVRADTVRRAGLAGIHLQVSGGPDQPLRDEAALLAVLEAADLEPRIRATAAAVIARLALAEAQVHGIDRTEVHFHEVGAVDTLVDIVGVVAGLELLGIERLTVGPIAVGTGTTTSAHGTLPLPVPAVANLLRGYELAPTAIAAELVTPTGAALIAELAIPIAHAPAMRLDRVGVGAGTRDHPGHANLLRLLVGEARDLGDVGSFSEVTTALMVEATIDDLSPELVPEVLDRLRDAGAHDAWASTVLMKKGRPGATLHALCDETDLDAIRATLYRESSTIGCRWYTVGKQALPRDWVEVIIDGHHIRVKLARHDGVIVNAAPEFGDVRDAAHALGRPARRVYAAAVRAADELLDR